MKPYGGSACQCGVWCGVRPCTGTRLCRGARGMDGYRYPSVPGVLAAWMGTGTRLCHLAGAAAGYRYGRGVDTETPFGPGRVLQFLWSVAILAQAILAQVVRLATVQLGRCVAFWLLESSTRNGLRPHLVPFAPNGPWCDGGDGAGRVGGGRR